MTEFGTLHAISCAGPQDCSCRPISIGVPKPQQRPPKAPTRLQARPRGVPTALKHRVLARDGYTCQWCREPGGSLDPHHILPRGRGGKDEFENLVSLHRRCHRMVHESPIEARRRGFTA